MTQHDDDRLATWLADGPPHAPAAGLERALSITRAARQRPAWLATALNGGAIGADRTASTMQLISIVVAVAALTVLFGGLLVSGWLRPPPTPPVVPPAQLRFGRAVVSRISPPPNSSASPVAVLGGGLILAYVPHEPAGECWGSQAHHLDCAHAWIRPLDLECARSDDARAARASLNFAMGAPDREHVLMTDELGQESWRSIQPTAAWP